jgi:hypothetical protein
VAPAQFHDRGEGGRRPAAEQRGGADDRRRGVQGALRESRAAYNGFTEYSDTPEAKKPMMASFVETAVKDYFAASKFLRRVLDAPKPDKREYVQKANDLIQKYNTLISRTNSVR